MIPPAPSRLTIGIPLHRSRPFVDVVSGNIEAATGPRARGRLAARHGRSPGATLLALAAAADYISDRLTREPRRRCYRQIGRL